MLACMVCNKKCRKRGNDRVWNKEDKKNKKRENRQIESKQSWLNGCFFIIQRTFKVHSMAQEVIYNGSLYKKLTLLLVHAVQNSDFWIEQGSLAIIQENNSQYNKEKLPNKNIKNCKSANRKIY